jgi:hypothetical protein
MIDLIEFIGSQYLSVDANRIKVFINAHPYEMATGDLGLDYMSL